MIAVQPTALARNMDAIIQSDWFTSAYAIAVAFEIKKSTQVVNEMACAPPSSVAAW